MLLLLGTILSLLLNAAQASDLRLGSVTASGSGCSGAAEASFDEKTKVLKVKLPPFEVQVTQESSLAQSRKSCNIVLGLTVPQKKRVLITKQAVYTRLDLPQGAAVNFSYETFMVSAGRKISHRVHAVDQPIKREEVIAEKNKVRGGCGAGENLRANLAVHIKPKPHAGTAEVSSEVLTWEVELEDCN